SVRSVCGSTAAGKSNVSLSFNAQLSPLIMRLKTIIVSVLVLVALSAVAFIARRPAPPPSTDARLNQSLVDRALIEKTTKLRIADAGKKVELARQTDGTWRVTSYFDLPADFSKLSG